MFEAEASTWQGAGIQVGADTREAEERLLSEALTPFGVARRSDALQMARLYAVLHCFENEVRVLIRETLVENVGANWWDSVPKRVRDRAERLQKRAEQSSWLEGERSDLLSFTEFGDLASIIESQWQYFDAIVPSQHWLKQRMDELESVRHFIAHNRMLLSGEFQRIYMYVTDWNRQIGL